MKFTCKDIGGAEGAIIAVLDSAEPAVSVIIKVVQPSPWDAVLFGMKVGDVVDMTLTPPTPPDSQSTLPWFCAVCGHRRDEHDDLTGPCKHVGSDSMKCTCQKFVSPFADVKQ